MADNQLVCGCKGIRTCLICEKQGKSFNQHQSTSQENVDRYFYCNQCHLTYRYSYSPLADGDGAKANCDNHATNLGPQINGIKVVNNFVTLEEESKMVTKIDLSTWTTSQSGRKKQDFGPKVNFKRRKLKVGNFNGLPSYCRYIINRMAMHDECKNLMTDFLPVELCNLDYSPDRGSAIDPHFDDFWIWGNRLVSVNLLSDTILTLSKDTFEVDVPMPRRSLLILYGDARNVWKHAIKRQNIHSRRVCMTFRELSNEFLPGGEQEELGTKLLHVALSFDGSER
ncbi:Alpha-ketoglutarate-dependent dioxygenase alkB-like protein 4 [Trichoplax sp. H2]|nr:Alpha-ketoglutarate-dependent dioxygenase alkB-like protein 4 [Trichoplax sp. H2]|eukprot:RDD36482.1 Alpha-ketoglutarate-dependent dioxygenase alkB-like protein 4 [Trichoplax sp. H2]